MPRAHQVPALAATWLRFVWIRSARPRGGVADLLRGDYKQSEYGKVILPLTVIRAFSTCRKARCRPQSPISTGHACSTSWSRTSRRSISISTSCRTMGWLTSPRS
ncbi:MAG: type I restriction-modification system subunit M N-terminal domain-containing protein [Thermoleophilia bacterium]